MKEVQIENTVTVTHYQAADGTLFKDEKQCQEYEESAYGVLAGKLSHAIVGDVSKAYKEFNGCDECYCQFIVPQNEQDIDTINHIYMMFEGKHEKAEKLFADFSDIGKPLLWCYRHDCSAIDWVWFYKLEDEIKNLTLGKFGLIEC